MQGSSVGCSIYCIALFLGCTEAQNKKCTPKYVCWDNKYDFCAKKYGHVGAWNMVWYVWYLVHAPVPPPPNHSIIRQKLSFEGIQHSNVILIGAPASPWAPLLSRLPPYPFLSFRVFYLPLPLLQPYPFLSCRVFYLPLPLLPPYPFLSFRVFYLPLSRLPPYPFFTMQSFLPSSALPPTLPYPFFIMQSFLPSSALPST